jgi:hypothetical protein
MLGGGIEAAGATRPNGPQGDRRPARPGTEGTPPAVSGSAAEPLVEIERYAVTLPAGADGQNPPTVIAVRRTRVSTGPGAPVYADATGRFRVTVTGDTAQPLPGTDVPGHTRLRAVPMP